MPIQPPPGVSIYAGGVVASGTNQATATAITSMVTEIGTAPANSGVRLLAVLYEIQWVINLAANAVSVYPQTGMAIGTLSANAAYSVGPGETVGFFVTSLTQVHALASSTSMLSLASLPTALPSSAGVLWNNGGVLSIS